MDKIAQSASQLACKYRAPVAVVERLISEETERVTAQARVMTFVPIFIARRVEDRLRDHTALPSASEHGENEVAA